MEIDIQDGRLQSHRPAALQRNNENSSMLTQALETSDLDLLDWCVDNTEPPKEITLEHLAHLLNFLSSRYWVYSQSKVLAWIHTLIVSNSSRLRNLEEFRPVLEDLKSKMQAKAQGIQQVARLKNTLLMVTSQNADEGYSVVSQPQMIINENE